MNQNSTLCWLVFTLLFTCSFRSLSSSSYWLSFVISIFKPFNKCVYIVPELFSHSLLEEIKPKSMLVGRHYDYYGPIDPQWLDYKQQLLEVCRILRSSSEFRDHAIVFHVFCSF
ncbi:uncharacterized protein LOC141659853 isoform X5 [Apium graveolens]|uniref:uncharacterized protein LOC141659853 isoform X5 n=1 Tax=Apium graveolens TaxID=4045 RepID=UPI003D7A1C68